MALSNVIYKGQSVTRAQLAINRGNGVKHCFACGGTKPFSEFSLARSRSDGHQPRCKACYALWKAARKKPPKPLLTAEQKRERRKAYRAANRDALREQGKLWMVANKAQFRAYAKEWRRENADRNSVVTKRWAAQNQEEIRARNKRYRQEHRAELAAHVRLRQCSKINATPKWVDKNAILVFYKEAKRLTAATGVLHHVDHIYPLKSKVMCGLHVPANLQLLTAAENIAKNNRFWPGKETDANASQIGASCA